MLRDWDFDTLHSSFGDLSGVQVEDGDISPSLSDQEGFIFGSEIWFDVTDYLEGVRNGADDNGVAILTKGTADGWQVHTHGSFEESARPRLVVLSADLGGDVHQVADCSGDGIVSADDLACVHTFAEASVQRDAVLAEIGSLPGDLDGDGEVAFADFLVLSGNFGMDNAAAPEYTSGNIDLENGVDFADFLVLSANFGQTPAGSAAAVPEPSAGLLASLAVLAVAAFRRRRA